jgi:hypothetical protein
MDLRKDILRFARRARLRLAFVRGVECATRSLLWVSLLACLAVAVHKLFGVMFPAWESAAVLGGIVLLTGILAALFPTIPLVQAAAALEEAAGWKERFSSALLLQDVTRTMEAALLDDVKALLAKASPSKLLPLRAPRELRWAPAFAVAAGLGFWLAPQFDVMGVVAEREGKEKEKKELVEAIKKIEAKKKDLEKKEQLSEGVKQVLEKIDAMLKEFEKTPPADKKEAMSKLSSLAEELQKMKSELAQSQALAEKLQLALSKEMGESGELGKLIKEGRFEAAAQELAKMRNKLQDGKMTPEEREKLKKQMDALAQKLKDAKDQEGLKDIEKKLAEAQKGMEEGKDEKMEGLQDALNELGDAMQDADALADALKDLEDLAESLAKGKGECPS